MRRWCGRSRTRCICGGSAGSGCADRVPDESTVRKLVRRLGAGGDRGHLRAGDRRGDEPAGGRAALRGARGADRLDGGGGRHPLSDRSRAGRRTPRGRSRARPAGRAGWPGPGRRACRDRSRAIAGRLRRVNRSIAARTGHSKPLALRLTGEAGELLAALGPRGAAARRALARSAPAVAAPQRQAGGGRAARAAGRAGREGLRADHACASRASRSPTGWSRSATPTRARSARASCAQPTEFGYVMQLTELCENTRRGARGLILPAPAPGSARSTSPSCCPATGQRLARARPAPARDRARRRLHPGPVARAPARARAAVHQRPPRPALPQDQPPAGQVPRRRRRPHQPPQTPLRPRPIRLKGHTGARTWAAWAILAYNLDTLALRAA